jgi:Ca-activated chloride channel family protein
LAAAQSAATRFLDRVPKSLQTGLVAYADGPHTVLRPTQDRDAIKSTIAALQANGGTATGDALESALNALGKRGAKSPPAAIVLLSDGASKTGRDPAEVAREAKAAGVPIYTVALGTADGIIQAQGQVLAVPPDPQALAEVASLSGGRAFAAEDSDALDQVYQTLGSRIGTKKEKREVSAGFAAVGLLLLGGAAFTSLRWRGRLP